MIDWLVKAAAISKLNQNQGDEKNDNSKSFVQHSVANDDPDYDNLNEICANDNFNGQRPLSTMVQFDDCNNDNDDDDDYAADETTTMDDATNQTQSSLSESANESMSQQETLISKCPSLRSLSKSCSPPARPTKREIMLKVLIENANLIGSVERQDTFYIDPSVCF